MQHRLRWRWIHLLAISARQLRQRDDGMQLSRHLPEPSKRRLHLPVSFVDDVPKERGGIQWNQRCVFLRFASVSHPGRSKRSLQQPDEGYGGRSGRDNDLRCLRSHRTDVFCALEMDNSKRKRV